MPKLYAARRFVLTPCVKCSYNDPLSITNRLFMGIALRDRFGYLNHFGPFDWVDEKDDVPVPDDSVPFGELMDTRAKEILAKDCLVTVSWSGGVDSSGVVVSLLKNGILPERLNILYSPSSKTEHPWLYRHLVDKKVKLIETEKISAAYNKLAEGVLVTGWCADQLFGSDIHLRNLNLYNLPWMDGVNRAFKERYINLSSRALEILEEVYSAYADYVGVKLEQFCEFAWLYNFGVKWSYVSQDSKMACTKQEARDRVINFYEDLPFQQWSMAQFTGLREYNIYRAPKYYKRPLKKYIYEYSADPDYFNKKGKVNSWALVNETTGYGTVSTYDTDGYHTFRIKDNPQNPNWAALNKTVMHKYFKEGYEE